jgi:hypothetical protein
MARLAGCNIDDIRKRMGPDSPAPAEPAWREKLWKK